MIKGFAAKVIDFVCSKRQLIIEYINRFYVLVNLKKNGLMAKNLGPEESKLNAPDNKEFSLNSNPFTKYREKLKTNFSELRENIKSKVVDLKNKILRYRLGKVFLKAFDEIKVPFRIFINRLKNQFIGFFSENVIKCARSMMNSTDNIIKIADGIYNKFESLKYALTFLQPGVVVWIIDFVVALICKHKEIDNAIESFKTAVDSKEPDGAPTKFYFFGKGLGKLLNVFSTSKTFSTTILKTMKLPIKKINLFDKPKI